MVALPSKSVTRRPVWRFFHRRDQLRKTAHASEQQRPDVLRRRRSRFETRPGLDPENLVFLDGEADHGRRPRKPPSGAPTKMARRRGRALRGHRCRAPVPRGRWKTTTFVGALRLNGMTASMVLDGAMHGAAFLAYVEQALAPRRSSPAISWRWTISLPTAAAPSARPPAGPGPTSSAAPPAPSRTSGKPSATP